MGGGRTGLSGLVGRSAAVLNQVKDASRYRDQGSRQDAAAMYEELLDLMYRHAR